MILRQELAENDRGGVWPCVYECGLFGSLESMIAHKETCPRRHQALAEAPKKLSREDLSEASGSGKSIRSDPSLAHALEVFEEEILKVLLARCKDLFHHVWSQRRRLSRCALTRASNHLVRKFVKP